MKYFIYNSNLYFGGAEVCFLNLCRSLCDSNKEVFVICDLRNERFLENIKNIRGLNLLSIDDFVPSMDLNNALYIFNGQTLRDFEKRFGFLNLKKYIWVMHPDELIAYSCKGYYKVKEIFGPKISKFYFRTLFLFNYLKIKRIRNMIDKGEVLFMDGSTYWASMRFLEKGRIDIKNENILPVPSNINPSVFNNLKLVDRKKISNIFYFGRVEDFKVNSILGLMDDMVEKKGMVLNIIGDGKCLNEVNLYAKRIGLRVNFYGFMDRVSAIKIINERADLVFAMGISALDSTYSKIPVVILNPYSGKNKFKKYNFLVDEVFSGVGEFIDSCVMNEKIKILKDFDEILLDVENNYKSFSENGFHHMMENHNNKFNIFVSYISEL